MKKHIPLIIGISLPIIFIIIISVTIFTPSLFIKPEHNFLYTVDDTYYSYNQSYKNTFTVTADHISLKPLPTPPNATGTLMIDQPTLYLYDVKTDTSHQITFDEAKNYTVDAGPSSPDGYLVKYESNNDGIFELFGSNRNSNGYFIEKGSGKKPLTGVSNGARYYYEGNLHLIAWIQ